MKKITFNFFFIIIAIIAQTSFAQPRYIETFDGVSPGSIPAGWNKVNNSGFAIRPSSHWLVRDSGEVISYLSPFTKTRSRSGKRAISANYYSAYDSVTFQFRTADAWLMTHGIAGVVGDSVRFFATGCYNNNLDSLQIWISTTNNQVASFTRQLGTVKWLPGSTYGQFSRYTFPLGIPSPGTVFIGFRYYMNCSNGDGYMVQIDDVALGLSVGIAENNSGLPTRFDLSQNYPNPFNPETTVRFDLPKQSSYEFIIFDMLGREVYRTSENNLNAGSYNLHLNMSTFSSGVYFYTLKAGDYFEKKKMMLLK